MWCCDVRFALVVPRIFCRTASRRLGYCYALREPPKPPRKRRNDSPHAQAGGPGPVSLRERWSIPKGSISPRHAPRAHPRGSLPLGFKGPCVQRPNATTSGPVLRPIFGPVRGPHFASQSPKFRADTPFLRAPKPGGGVISSGALLGATGGTQTHSRRTGSKLGRLRYARQGLVRVPESNTKYGGLGGITGVDAAPVMAPSISESTRIPKQKNYPHGCEFPPAPTVHSRGIFSARAIEFSGLT